MKNLFYITLLSSLLVIGGCGKTENTTATPEEKIASTEGTKPEEAEEALTTPEEEPKAEVNTKENFIADAAKIEKTVAKIKELTGGGKIFQSLIINLKEDGSGSQLILDRQDPNNLENVDHFFLNFGKWEGPTPVKISGSKPVTAEDITKNSWDIDSVNWKAIPDLIKDAEERTKDIEGIEFSQIQIRHDDGVIMISMRGTRKDATYWANLDGSFKKLDEK